MYSLYIQAYLDYQLLRGYIFTMYIGLSKFSAGKGVIYSIYLGLHKLSAIKRFYINYIQDYVDQLLLKRLYIHYIQAYLDYQLLRSYIFSLNRPVSAAVAFNTTKRTDKIMLHYIGLLMSCPAGYFFVVLICSFVSAFPMSRHVKCSYPEWLFYTRIHAHEHANMPLHLEHVQSVCIAWVCCTYED